MKMFEINHISTYSDFCNADKLLPIHLQSARLKLCYKHKKHYLDRMLFECNRGNVDDACFNMYANLLLTNSIYNNFIADGITTHMYTDIVSQEINMRQTWYGIKIYDGDVHTDTIYIVVDKSERYHYTNIRGESGDGWPNIIPESYKSKIVFKESEYKFISDELNDSNIELKDDKLYVEGKEINEYGYYVNKDDMYKIQGSYYKPHLGYKLYIHTPFNAINLSLPDIKTTIKQYIGKYLKNIEICVVGDNTQLSNVTNIRIGGIEFGDECLKLFAKEQQPYIIRQPSTYNIDLLYRWKTTI